MGVRRTLLNANGTLQMPWQWAGVVRLLGVGVAASRQAWHGLTMVRLTSRCRLPYRGGRGVEEDKLVVEEGVVINTAGATRWLLRGRSEGLQQITKAWELVKGASRVGGTVRYELDSERARTPGPSWRRSVRADGQASVNHSGR